MEKIDVVELNPITEMCSIFVNMNGPLDLKAIDESIILFIHIYMCGKMEHDPEWKLGENERSLMRLSLKMEMILRNIMFNDEFAMKLTDSQLEGYLTAKAYIHTRHYPPLIYVRSVIKMYRSFAKVSYETMDKIHKN